MLNGDCETRSVDLMNLAKKDNDALLCLDGLDNVIRVHAAILRTRSPIFRNLLVQSCLQNVIISKLYPAVIHINANGVECVKNMVYWMYVRKIKHGADLFQLLRLSSVYQIDGLQKDCINLLMATVGDETFVRCLQAFELYKIKSAYQALVVYGQKNWKKVKEFKDIDKLDWQSKTIMEGGYKLI